MLWHELSWPEIDRVDRGTPVVVPLGSCEQHGHHLPVNVDTLQVDAIARSVESRLRDRMLLTQSLWLGSSHHHKDFPGTISITPTLYTQVIRQVAEGLIGSGFHRIFFLNGHGGNRVPAGQALTDLIATDDRADETLLALASWWEVGCDALKKTRFSQATISHACEVETSLMLEIRADLVHLERIKNEQPALVNEWHHSENDLLKKVSLYQRFHRITAAGSLGEAQQASQEKGARLFSGVVDELVRFVSEFATWPAPAKLGPK
jgi:creatinine amidohydrolase